MAQQVPPTLIFYDSLKNSPHRGLIAGQQIMSGQDSMWDLGELLGSWILLPTFLFLFSDDSPGNVFSKYTGAQRSPYCSSKESPECLRCLFWTGYHCLYSEAKFLPIQDIEVLGSGAVGKKTKILHGFRFSLTQWLNQTSVWHRHREAVLVEAWDAHATIFYTAIIHDLQKDGFSTAIS